MTFNFDVINSSMGKKITQAEQDLGTFAENMDPDNSTDLILFQQKIQEFGLITNLQSTTVKSLKDSLTSIVQKMQ